MTCRNGTPVVLVTAGVPHVCHKVDAAIAAHIGPRTFRVMNARRTPLPAPALTDPIWTVEHIALALRREVRSTRAVIAQPGFPPAFQPIPGANTRKYWMADQVLAHFAALRPGPTASAAAPTAAGPAVAPADDTHAAALARLRSLPKASGGAR